MQDRTHDIERRRAVIAQLETPLREMMLQKLNPDVRWSYLNFPEGRNRATSKLAMQQFIENNLPEFIARCQAVLPQLTELDAESLSQKKLTENAQQFIDIFAWLETVGFLGIRDFGQPINFWCGEEARQYATTRQNEVSDSRIPSIALMFDVCRLIHRAQNQYDDYIMLLGFCVSRFYTSHASNDVNIYLSSDKLSELPGLTVNNHFWMAELPALMAMHRRGLVTDIKINLHDQVAGWLSPVSLFLDRGQQIPIRRRDSHSLDSSEHLDRFKNHLISSHQILEWRQSKARPMIRYGALKRIAQEWRNRARVKTWNEDHLQNHKSSPDYGKMCT